MNLEKLKLLRQTFQLDEGTFVKTNKEGLVKAISEMDMVALEMILEDDLSYQDTSKKIFLKKLNEIFIEFKNEDNILIPYEGKCQSEECVNKNKYGIAFVGNKSKRYLNLLIEENENGKIRDIYSCYDFCTDQNTIDKSKRRFSITIYNDEKVDFIPNSTYTYLKNKCARAIYELQSITDRLITKDELIEWVSKYEFLFSSFELPPLFYKVQNKFFNLYHDVNKIYEFLNLEEEATKAINEFKKVDIDDEPQLLKWLVKYEHFHYDLILLRHDSISEFALVNGKEKISKELNIYFNIEILRKCIDLENIIDKYYYAMIDKYNTETFEQNEIQIDNCDKRYSLRNHLEKRGIIPRV